MKILFIAHYQNDGSPSASFIHSQVKAIKQLGNEVLVIVPLPFWKRDYHKHRVSSLSRRETIDGIDHVFVRYLSLSRYGEKNFNAKSAICSMKGEVLTKIKQFNPDVIHAHTIGFDSEIGKWVKERTKKKLIVTIHGSDLDIPLRMGRLNLIKNRLRDIDHVITISKKLQRNVEEIEASTETTTILNGCNVDRCYLGEKKRHSILFVGNLIGQKNVKVVIKAFGEIKRSYEDASLMIVGKGEEEDNLRTLCKQLELEQDVKFTGQIPNEQVLMHMSESDYFFMPSVNEGFGIVYIEAMACGCITFGTKNEGISDFIEHTINGILVEANVKSILGEFVACEKGEYQKETIRENAMKDARQLSWEKNAELNIQIYKKVCKK